MRNAALFRKCLVAACVLAAGIAGCTVSHSLPNSTRPSETLHRGATGNVTIREFADLPRYSGAYLPFGIASGPDGSLWVTDCIDSDFGPNAVVQLATSGKC